MLLLNLIRDAATYAACWDHAPDSYHTLEFTVTEHNDRLMFLGHVHVDGRPCTERAA